MKMLAYTLLAIAVIAALLMLFGIGDQLDPPTERLRSCAGTAIVTRAPGSTAGVFSICNLFKTSLIIGNGYDARIV